jgi:hypothetical protein
MNSSQLALLSGVLLATILVVSATMHRSMIDACVCVVNSAGRASVALGLATVLGAVLGIHGVAASRVANVIQVLQVISFAASLFFLIQHVFFVLQLA